MKNAARWGTVVLLAYGFALLACGSDDAADTGASGIGGTGGANADAGDGSAAAGGTAGSGGTSGAGGTGGGAGSSGTGASGGSAGAGASAGNAGNAGNAGSAGNAGNAGSAGNAGNAGSAGNAGTSGNAGSAGAPAQCSSATDCTVNTDVCDPASLSCVPSTCDPTDYQSCPDFPQTICLDQANGQGACYVDCTPFQTGTGCSPGSDCLVQSDDESLGLCFGQGPASVGSPCEVTDTTTGCVAGAVCANLGTSSTPDRRCIKTCQVFSDEPAGCPSGELCMVGSVCLSTSYGIYDAVDVGQPCTLGDYYFCGEVDGRLTGTCDDAPSGGTDLICYTWCRLSQGTSGSPDCPAGFSCTDTDWGNGLGVCVQD